MEWIRALVSCALVAAVSADRLTTVKNPDCGNTTICQEQQHLVATAVATNSSEDILYIWSDVGAPAISVARTPKPRGLNVEWNEAAETSADEPILGIDLDVNYVQTSMFTRLMALNTTTYTPGQTPYFTCQLVNQTWMWGDSSNIQSSSDVKVNLTMLPELSPTNDTCDFSILFSTSDTDGREQLLPHLKYSENSTRVELVFRNFNLSNHESGEDLATTMGLNFILEVIIVPDLKHRNLSLTSGKSLDDEYTPSQFWHSQIENGHLNGFHYWKPIVYTDISARKIKNSVHIETEKVGKFGKLLKLSEAGIEMPYGLATMLNNGKNVRREDVRVLYLSFNATQSSTQVFDVVIGIGEVPTDTISLTVILIIALGLGLPAVVLLFGVPSATIYKRYKKKKSNQSGYAPIQ